MDYIKIDKTFEELVAEGAFKEKVNSYEFYGLQYILNFEDMNLTFTNCGILFEVYFKADIPVARVEEKGVVVEYDGVEYLVNGISIIKDGNPIFITYKAIRDEYGDLNGIPKMSRYLP